MQWLAEPLSLVESEGRWPWVLARGCTALVPKECPPRALNTRPLTVLLVVYRLWAGVRLQEMIGWQDRWAHPPAFGFRPARSAADGTRMVEGLAGV